VRDAFTTNTEVLMSGRRIVQQVTLTYTMEGDDTERSITLRRDGDAGVVDGVVWGQSLMDRLGYLEAQQGAGCRPVTTRPARPGDGWRRDTPQRTAADPAADVEEGGASTADGPADDECIWLHKESCVWISWCDPW
jgi:hypothetical protein